MIKYKYVASVLFILIFSQAVQAENKKNHSPRFDLISKRINENAKQNASNSPLPDTNKSDSNNSSFLSKAENGDVCAQTKIGHNYTHSQGGLRQDYEKAIEWYTKAANTECKDEKCKQCQIGAYSNLGYLYSSRLHPRDHKNAFTWYLKAADNGGFRTNSTQLAKYYSEGEVIKQNYEKAYYWATRGKNRNIVLRDDYIAEIISHLTPEQIKKIDDQNEVYLQELAQKQRNNYANLMDIMTLGFNPDAPLPQKALSRLGFEIGLNEFHYDLTGIKKLIDMGALEAEPINAYFMGKPIPVSNLLFQAQKNNDLDLVKLLIEGGADINDVDERGFTVLHRAIGHDHTEIALELINAGADLTIASTDLYATPLMAASGQGYLSIVKALIEAGANVNQQVSESGRYKNALEKALFFKRYDVARYLKQQGAEIRTKYRNYPDPIPAKDLKCSAEGKTCPDKSLVKRAGEFCEFPACPEPKYYEPAKKIAGTFSEIDTELSAKAIHILNNRTKEEKDKVIADIKANPENYNPSALNALSQTLFSRIEDQEAAFWYMAAFLRRRQDALICEDKTSQKKMHGNLFVHQYRPYTEKNPQIMMALLDEVLEWDRTTPYSYDTRWINVSYGIKNNLTDPIPERLCIPKNKWAQAREFQRNEYASNFHKFIKGFDYRADPAPKLKSFYLSKEEFKAILDKAEAGDAEAQYKIATVALTHAHNEFLGGDGATFRNKWLQAAAKQGHVGAITKVGQRYLSGYKVSAEQKAEKFEEGKIMLIEAGKKGSLTAFWSIGGYYLGKKDPIEAYAWFSLSEYMLLQKQPQLQMFPAKQKKKKLEATMPDEDLEKAKIKAQEYIEKYADK